MRFVLTLMCRDGFGAAEFHSKCDDKGPTLAIIRSHPHNYQFGGYNPLSWKWEGDGRNWTIRTHPDCFVFTLNNPHGIPPTKYSIIRNGEHEAYAIITHKDYGPMFGCGPCIRVANKSNQFESDLGRISKTFTDTTGKDDLTFTGKNKFMASEVEVYLVE